MEYHTIHVLIFIPAVIVYSLVAGSLYYYFFHEYHLDKRPAWSFVALVISGAIGTALGFITFAMLDTLFLKHLF